MENKELFIDSHRELLKLVHQLSTPIFYAPKWTISNEALQNLKEGDIIFGEEPVGQGIETIYKLPKESAFIILETFCKSHLLLADKG